jgi:hypothetical protein
MHPIRMQGMHGTGLGSGLGGRKPPFCIAWGLGGFARVVLHRFAMHGQRPPSKAMQHPPCNATPCEACEACPPEAYRMQSQ